MKDNLIKLIAINNDHPKATPKIAKTNCTNVGTIKSSDCIRGIEFCPLISTEFVSFSE